MKKTELAYSIVTVYSQASSSILFPNHTWLELFQILLSLLQLRSSLFCMYFLLTNKFLDPLTLSNIEWGASKNIHTKNLQDYQIVHDVLY